MKRNGIIISDLHCGHRVGLTHPWWQIKPKKGSTTKSNKWYKIQAELWQSFTGILDSLPARPEIILNLGDNIDGDGGRSGGTELITTDREEQADMAVAVHNTLREYCTKDVKIIGVYGTAYHTGQQEDWEDTVAHKAGFDKIGSHEWVDINGCIIDLKHHCGGSTVPHGRSTATLKEAMWNGLWAERGLVPKANVILRGHTHFYQFGGNSTVTCISCPALQGMGSKFGGRRCSGIVDWGLIYFEIDDNGVFDYKAYVATIDAQKTEAIVL